MSGVPSTGPITLGKIYQEIDGSGYSNAADSGEEASLEDMSTNDTPDSLNSDGWSDSTNNTSGETGSAIASTPYKMSEFRGYNQTYSAFSWGSNGGVSQGWGSASGVSPFTANATSSIGFAFQPADNRVRVKSGNGNNSTMVTYSYNSVTYSGTDPDQVEFKIVWTGVFSGSYNSSSEASGSTSGTYYTMSKQTTSSDSGTFTMRNWFIQKSSGQGGAAYNAIGANSPVWTFRAKDSSGNVMATSGTSSQNGISLSVTRGQQGGEFFCIHEDMLVNTEFGPMHIKDVVEKDPRLWSYNHNTKQKELVDQIKNVQVLHDNLYIINNEFMITEDHVMYGDNHEQYSIKPELALKKYGKHSQKLKVGDKLSTLSGDKYIVNTIEKLEGEHNTYTISTQYNNFYANDILVDSEI